jgi:hypothetical protein
MDRRKERPVRLAILASTLSLFPAVARSAPPGAATRFDGAWTATVSCPAAAGAMGYSFEVPTQVKAGVLHGERMAAAEPGHLELDGQIGADGHARLYAKGLVGAAPFAVGQRPRGTDYGYHVEATFEDAKGGGARVEGRRCDLTFVRR